MTIKLKPITPTTAPLLRKWRNENRQVFLDTRIVSRQRHEQWLAMMAEKEDEVTYVIYADGIPMGTIGASMHSDGVEIERVILGEKQYQRQGVMGKA